MYFELEVWFFDAPNCFYTTQQNMEDIVAWASILYGSCYSMALLVILFMSHIKSIQRARNRIDHDRSGSVPPAPAQHYAPFPVLGGVKESDDRQVKTQNDKHIDHNTIVLSNDTFVGLNDNKVEETKFDDGNHSVIMNPNEDKIDNNTDKNTQVDGDIFNELMTATGYDAITKQLKLPYKEGKIFSRLKYELKSLVVKNPRLFSLYLLYKSVSPRILTIVDMVTDVTIATQLYSKNSSLLFSLTLLCLSFPFVMVWATSLRFIQKYVNSRNVNINTNKNTNKNKNSNNNTESSDDEIVDAFKNWLLNFLLILYLFPPIGMSIVPLCEIGWVFYDIFFGLYSFVKGKMLIIDKNSQYTAIKHFRRIIEFFGESIPQVRQFKSKRIS